MNGFSREPGALVWNYVNDPGEHTMTAITTLATLVVLAVALLPAIAELVRIRTERHNPIRLLRVKTRRNQVLGPEMSHC
jgi:hypothetical protein